MRIASLAVLGAVVILVAGCSTSEQPTPSSPTSRSAAPAAKVGSLIDARWIGFSPSPPLNWVEMERGITPETQRFGFRPFNEVGGPRFCQGCGEKAVTAEVTVYAVGRFDPTYAKTGQPVDVNGHGGFFHPATWDAVGPEERDGRRHDAVLTWQYADTAWASVQAMTPLTANVDRMLELARALRPDERTPVRVPLSLANVPTNMPLAGMQDNDFGTTLEFGPCTTQTRGQDCATLFKSVGSLRVQIVDGGDVANDVTSDGSHAVLVQDGMSAQFDMNGPNGTALPAEFEDILGSVTWAPDPGDDATWLPVSDWVK
jgi:hypothetical protein